MTSGYLFLIEKEIREKFKKEGHSNFAYETIIYLLDSFLSSLHFISITYIYINRETEFFKNLQVKCVKNIKIKHISYIQKNYVWFIFENKTINDPKRLEREK